MEINQKVLSDISNEDLIEFILLNRFEPESYDVLESTRFQELPSLIKAVVYLSDFDTEYEMQGILGFLQNSPGLYINEIIESFEMTNNHEIAGCLKEILQVLNKYNSSVEYLRQKVNNMRQYEISTIGSVFENEDLVDEILEVDKRLFQLVYV